MTLITLLFWISLTVLFYCYLGYGGLIFAWNRLRRSFANKAPIFHEEELPPVTIIIAAFNEGPVLADKLINTQALDYPPEKIKIIVVTDGSTDGSPLLADAHPGAQWIHETERRGKYAAICRAMKLVQTPIVIFSDANTRLNRECLRLMVRHFADNRTGGVAGEKRILSPAGHSAVGEAEGLYWRYESFMKKQDAEFHTVVGAAGELFGIRTSLFQEDHPGIILDDFLISMRICLQGYRIRYEPGAFATETPSISLKEEAKRKIRISAGAYQSIGFLKDCLNLFRYPILGFQYISRRLLRWVFCPWMLLLLFLTNLWLMQFPEASRFYTYFFYVQLGFYLLAIMGGILIIREKSAGIFAVPFYFLFMNYCLVNGFIRFLRNKQSPLWERSTRNAVI